MREIRMSGLMSGDGKRGGVSASVLAPILDSTSSSAGNHAGAKRRLRACREAAAFGCQNKSFKANWMLRGAFACELITPNVFELIAVPGPPNTT